MSDQKRSTTSPSNKRIKKHSIELKLYYYVLNIAKNGTQEKAIHLSLLLVLHLDVMMRLKIELMREYRALDMKVRHVLSVDITSHIKAT